MEERYSAFLFGGGSLVGTTQKESERLPAPLRGPLSALTRNILLTQLPILYEHHRTVLAEALQASIWIVGLSTGLLAYSSLATAGLPWMSQEVRGLMLVLLLGSIVLGVLFRLAMNDLDFARRKLQWEQLARLSGMNASPEEPWDPDELTNVDEIVLAFKDSFGRDSAFLRTPPLTLADARRYYRVTWERWIEEERVTLDQVGEILAAAEGAPEPGNSGMFAQYEGLEQMRLASRELMARGRYANWAYYGQLAAFLGALFALVLAGIRR